MTTALAWLTPADVSVPAVLRCAELGTPAWNALIRDDVLRPVWGDLAVPADREITAAERARSLLPHVPARAVVGRMTAAWVHTGLEPPVTLDLLVAPGRRRLSPDPGRRTHECPLPEDDLTLLSGIRLTTVQRTGLDLARWELGRGRSALIALDGLLGTGFDAHEALMALEEISGQRGLCDARRHLRAMLELASRTSPSEADRRLVGVPGAGDAVDVEDAFDLADRSQHRRQVGRLGHLEDEA
jgi:hypothetical protein